MDLAQRIQLWISYVIRFSLLVAIIISVAKQQWMNLFLDTTILFITFLPALIQHNIKVKISTELEFLMIFFAFATLYLGEVHNFYIRFWWWDVFLHSIAGMFFGFIGFLIVYILNYEEKVKIRMGPKFIALFSFVFGLATGALWEIVEFTLDSLFHLNMQKSSLVDTMWDLIIDAAGALVVSLSGYVYVKKKRAPFFDRVLRKFMEANPNLFQKRKRKS